MQEFEARDWVNDEYGKMNEWLWECFGTTEDYVPLVRDWDDKEACPRIALRSGLEDDDEEEEEEEEKNGDGVLRDMVESLGAGGRDDDEVVFQGRGCKISVSY
jgi:hypothetical protein